jgi:FkbM family methyltransferase
MTQVKRFFKRNSHNGLFKALAGFGRSLNRFYENRNHDIYSNGELTVIKKLAKHNPMVIIDGGANTGSYSLLINKLCPGSLVYSFEPVKSTFEKLKENVADYNNIIPLNKGLFNDNCTREINLYESNIHSSLYDIQGLPYESKGRHTIELICGDDFVKDQNIGDIDLLKIDVEGAEYDAILGFERHIEKGKIKAIQFEYGYINIFTKKLLIDYYNYFEGKGYVIGKIFPKVVEFRKYEFKYEDFLGPNFIAVKKTETGLISSLIRK